MVFAWIVNALALALGAGLGARALYDPDWAQRLVRLKADEQGGGFAEFRATYGGLFLFTHLLALAMTLFSLLGGEYVIGVAASGASAVLSAGWAGAGAGRALSIWRDRTDTKFNRQSVGVEFAMAFAIGMPWLAWFLGG
jgi:hypothetical protein